MEDETSVRRLHKFSARRGEDFTLLTLRFEALLESKDLLDCVSMDPLDNVSFSELEAEARSRVLKTKSLLVQSLGDKPLRTVAGERKNAYQMYKKLQERYATQNTTTRDQLQTELYQKCFKKPKTMSKYVDEFESIFNQLDIMDNSVSESM